MTRSFSSFHPMQRRALAASIAFALITPVAWAQESTSEEAPDGESATTLDRVQVTGSRIRQADIETAQPVQIISRSDIEKQGFQSVADILQTLPSVMTPTITRSEPLSAGEQVGGQYIQMRGLGATRTLILVNGKRLGISTDGFQDISRIPTVMVERVEVLKDGASSIYGSDAIGGVINIITRRNFDGMVANAYYGQYSEGDGETTRGDVAIGVSGDRGSVMIGAEYREEARVGAADREFVAYSNSDLHPTRNWSANSQYGILRLPGQRLVLREGADYRNIANYRPQNVNNNETQDKSNTNLQMDMRTPLESMSLYARADYDLTEAVRWNADFLYTDRQASRQVAGYPFDSTLFGTVISRDSYFNPLGSHHGAANPQDVIFDRRTWELPRKSDISMDSWRFSTGLEGSFERGSRVFDWDVGYLYNSTEILQVNNGQLNLDAIDLALGPSFFNAATGRVECGTASNPIPYGSGAGACIPWNPLIPYGRTGDGGLSGDTELQAFLSPSYNTRGRTETRLYTANLTGSLFALPGGDAGFAVGVESRKETGEYVPDAASIAGRNTDLAAGPTQGGYSVNEAYVEFLLPLLANIPGARELSVTLASRYSDFDTFGDTTNSKFGLKWKPFDALLVRGTWAEGFRAPTVGDLYGGTSQTFARYTDPCDTVYGESSRNPTVRARCRTELGSLADSYRQPTQGYIPSPEPEPQSPVPFTSGSNPDLQPETSVTRTAGVVWSPGFANNFNLSLDWWRVRVENTIVADSPTQMLADCYVQGIESRCNAFTREGSNGLRYPGMIDTLHFGNRNAGYVEIEGYDFGMSYRLGTDHGDYTVDWQSTYTTNNEFRTTNDEGALPQRVVGFWDNFRIKSVMALGWQSGDWSATWTARYYSSFKDSCLSATLFPEECSDPGYRSPSPGATGTGPKNRYGSNTFNDVEFRYATPWNATIAVGALNVFERIGPPVYNTQNRNSSLPYLGVFDIGRFVYLKYQQRF